MCRAHYRVHCCLYCGLAMHTDRQPYRCDTCLPTRRAGQVTGRVALGVCVLGARRRVEDRVPTACCADCNHLWHRRGSGGAVDEGVVVLGALCQIPPPPVGAGRVAGGSIRVNRMGMVSGRMMSIRRRTGEVGRRTRGWVGAALTRGMGWRGR